MKKVKILDTTLRDGSYSIDFKFTSGHTASICEGLEKSGVKLIEIGHGMGLGATRKGHSPAIESDAEYLSAARGVLKEAKFGMFCIPGLADLEDLDMAADHQMGFVRIGTDVTRIPDSETFIRRAKKHGMFVAANYMKSYALTPTQFAEQVKLSESYGADMVYIVDSAGGMFPEQIREYYSAIRDVTDLPVGFHAHNNLGLAVSNSLEAVKCGIEYIDTSLQGMGRSAGNASTELMVAALTKMGVEHGLNMLELLKMGPHFVQPLNPYKGIMPLDVVAGFADFHSSYMPHILKSSAKYKVDPAILIIELCKVDKVGLDPVALDKLAMRISDFPHEYKFGEYGYSIYIGGEQENR